VGDPHRTTITGTDDHGAAHAFRLHEDLLVDNTPASSSRSAIVVLFRGAAGSTTSIDAG